MRTQEKLRKLLSFKAIFAVAILSLFMQVFAINTPTNAWSLPTYYKVNTSSNPSNGGAVWGGGYYRSGNNATLMAVPAFGYTFTGWSGDCSGSSPTYTIKGIDSDKNCTATFKMPLVVVGTSLRVTTEKIYDGNNTVAAATGLVIGIRTGDSVTVSAIAKYDDENIGTHKIINVKYDLSGLDSSKYIIVSDGFSIPCGVITPKPISITADPQSKIYGEVDPVLTYSGNLEAGDSFSGALARAAGEDVGTYAITQGSLSAGSNYTINFTSADLTINKKDLNVFATAATKVYGNADPILDYTYDTLIGEDTISGDLARATGENVGTYEINQGTVLLSDNYNLIFHSEYLTITAAPITIAIDSQSKIYGTADPLLTYQITSGSLVGSDLLNIAFNRTVGENVGKYEISGISSDTNYAVTITPEYLTITKAPITVTAKSQSKTAGAADPDLTYSITSGYLVGTDAFTGLLARPVGETAGTYAINQGTLSLSENYELTFVGSILTISTPAQAFVSTTNDIEATVEPKDDGVVLGETTPKAATAKSDSKNTKESGFCDCKLIGIHCWIWLLILLVAIGAIWIFIAKRKKGEE